MNQFDAMNSHLQLIRLPEDRALVQRWFLRFLADNPRFTALQAAEIAAQVARRWGTDVIRDSYAEAWVTRPLPATRAEWESDGYRVPRDARPLLITGRDGRQVELFPLFDVDLVREDLVGAVDHDRVRQPAPPAEGASDLAEFALHLGERERHAFSHLWKVGAMLHWAGVSPADEAPYLGPLGWIERVNDSSPCRPAPGMGAEDACYLIRIHPDADAKEVLGLGLSLTAQLLIAWTQGRRAGEKLCGNGEGAVSDLELGIVTWVVGRRLGFGNHHANVDAFRFIEHLSDFPAPPSVDWGRIVEVAGVMEDLLTGEFTETLPVPEPPALNIDAVPGLVLDPFGVVDHELAMYRAGVDGADGEAAERWMLAFVASNARFPMGVALALGLQLYRRWGSSVAGDDTRAEWAGSVDVRTVDEWWLRGQVPNPSATLLAAPGTHGQEVYYLLRDETLVADRLAALQSAAEGDPARTQPFRAGPQDAPELAEFTGLVSDREKEMLRNFWRVDVLPVIVDPEEGQSEASLNKDHPPHRLPVTLEEGVNPMFAIIEHFSNWVLAYELGVLHSAPVIGHRYWAASEAESALVAHIAASRLNLDFEPSPLVEEALSRKESTPGIIRWGVIYHAASEVEDVLRGHPS